MDRNKQISILGCGWYGMELGKELVQNGYHVKGSTTSAEKLSLLKAAGIKPYLVAFQEEEQTFDADFFCCDVLVICIPPRRSTAEQHTFFKKIERISVAATASKIPQLLFISSTSVYGDENKAVDELTTPDPDTDSGKAMLAVEEMLNASIAFQTTIIRFGGLIGPNRDPGRFFAGKKDIANGKAPVNLIHLNDCIGITLAILEQEAFGYTFNACSTEHPSRAEFYTNAILKAGLERAEFKDELISWKLINSINIPKQLVYTFKFSMNSIVSQ